MIIAILVVVGLALGSFVNALVWRLHEQQKSEGRKQKTTGLSIVNGRSMCPHCKHTLAALDLIPVLSWLSLRGKCRYCKKPIHWQYPLVELTTAALFVVSYVFWPHGFAPAGTALFLAWLILLTGLVALVVYDFTWMLLPNRIVYPLIGFWSVVTLVLAIFFGGGLALIIGSLLGLLSCGGVFWVLFQLSNGRWIGGGDVKLGFLLGLVVGGPAKALLVIFVASLVGLLWASPLLLAHKLKPTSRIPFGPFLIIAGMLVFLFGTALVEWYSRYFLLAI